MGVSHPLQAAVEPVINTHPTPTAGKEQAQQQYEVGDGELDAVVEDDQAAAAGQPVVVAVLLQQCLGSCELFGGGGYIGTEIEDDYEKEIEGETSDTCVDELMCFETI